MTYWEHACFGLRFLSCVCGKLQFALVAACISYTVWRTLEWKQINKHHSPTERPQTHTFSLLPLTNTPHNAVSELPLRTVISRKLWWWHLLGAERKRTVPQRKMIERDRERLRKWKMRSEERVKSKGTREVDRTDNEGEIKRGQIGISCFSLLCVQRPGPGPVSQGHASLEHKHPARPMWLFICPPLH